MSGSGKGMLGMVGISQNESGAGTFPDRNVGTPTLSNPGKEHWVAINCLLHYLSTTRNYKLVYDGNFPTNDRFRYSDSNWAGDPRDY